MSICKNCGTDLSEHLSAATALEPDQAASKFICPTSVFEEATLTASEQDALIEARGGPSLAERMGHVRTRMIHHGGVR